MRKKSHISLAGYLLDSMQVKELKKHRKAFKIGSILPDCMPSFLTRRHTIEETFDIVKKNIRRLTEEFDVEKGFNGRFCRRLGVLTHYLADYCTLPHNSIFQGTIKEHCAYEARLKDSFKDYVRSKKESGEQKMSVGLLTGEEILNLIVRLHEEYLSAVREIKKDCEYIVEICCQVVDAILNFCEQKKKIEFGKEVLA